MSHCIRQSSFWQILFLAILLHKEHFLAITIEGTTGQDILITFEVNKTEIKNANLYKDGNKTAQSDKMPLDSRQDFNLTLTKAFLTIKNLTAEDSGCYYVSFFLTNQKILYVESAKVNLVVHVATSEPPPITNSTEATHPELHPPTTPMYLYIISGLGATAIVLSVVLLSWFRLTQNTDYQQPERSGTRFQVTEEGSSSLAVYSIEYGVLDFPSRPHGQCEAKPGPRDSVEYSTVTFPPRGHHNGAT